MIRRVYLAGPDVFRPDAASRFALLRAICAGHGLVAVTPLDPLPGDTAGDAAALARRNEAHIRGVDAVLANLTPFRGPGVDGGTAYEVGFARALGLPVFGYATVSAPYAARVRALPGSSARHDPDGLEIEDFGLFENLMISCSLSAMLTTAGGDGLDVFTRCAVAAARL